jgi:hypothetical protein
MNGGSTFEYDEDTEAYNFNVEGDESEADEADESEADEGSDEADEGSDEFAMEGSDEADEGSDESEADEADEAVMTASARLQADQDKNRRAEWARRIAADQRVEAQRAASTQRNITSQIRSIQAGGPARVATVGSLQGAGVVTAILPNGRRSRMRILPTVAPIAEVNRLRSVVQVNERRQAIATHKNSRAIASLAMAQAAAVKKLTDQQVKSDKDLGKRLVEGHNRLDKRITKELTGGTGSLDKHSKRLVRQMKRQRQRALLNSVLLASSAPLYAAYGDRSKPWAKNNLLLTLPLVGWMVGDEVLDSFAGKSKAARGIATTWSWTAPVWNAAISYFLFRKQQHERFISGVNTYAVGAAGAGGPFFVDIKTLIGPSSFAAFSNGNHSIQATVAAGTAGQTVQAAFNADKSQLIFTFDPGVAAAANATVAWIVDTQPPTKTP